MQGCRGCRPGGSKLWARSSAGGDLFQSTRPPPVALPPPLMLLAVPAGKPLCCSRVPSCTQYACIYKGWARGAPDARARLAACCCITCSSARGGTCLQLQHSLKLRSKHTCTMGDMKRRNTGVLKTLLLLLPLHMARRPTAGATAAAVAAATGAPPPPRPPPKAAACRPLAHASASLRRGTMFMLCSSWKSSLQA